MKGASHMWESSVVQLTCNQMITIETHVKFVTLQLQVQYCTQKRTTHAYKCKKNEKTKAGQTPSRIFSRTRRSPSTPWIKEGDEQRFWVTLRSLTSSSLFVHFQGYLFAKRVPGHPDIRTLYIKTLALRCERLLSAAMKLWWAWEGRGPQNGCNSHCAATDQQRKSARKGTSKSFKSLGNASSFTFQQQGASRRHCCWILLWSPDSGPTIQPDHSELDTASYPEPRVFLFFFTMLVTNQQEVPKPATWELLPSGKCGGFAFKTSLRLTVAIVCKVALFHQIAFLHCCTCKNCPVWNWTRIGSVFDAYTL